jgi:hypothetical protein
MGEEPSTRFFRRFVKKRNQEKGGDTRRTGFHQYQTRKRFLVATELITDKPLRFLRREK